MIGKSQYFFRTRKKNHSSRTIFNTAGFLSKLIFHILRHGIGGGSLLPIRLRIMIQFQPERVFSAEAHQHPDRENGRKENDSHNNRVYYMKQEQAKTMPKIVKRA